MDMLHPDNGQITLFNKKLRENEAEIKQNLAYIGSNSAFPKDTKLIDIKKMIAPFYKSWDESLYSKIYKKIFFR